MTPIVLKQEVEKCLHDNILPFWLKFQDEENGGFYGRMKGDGTLVKDANKGCILNARILWSFSAAYRVTGRSEYLAAATRAKDYILEHFIDPLYGGAFWELDCLGQPVDTKKQFYAIGFCIYGLTEYVRAISEHFDAKQSNTMQIALRTAVALYESIEEHSFDEVHNGYIEACTREWNEMADMRLSDLDANYPKSQNTHLHIIEPYTSTVASRNLLQRMKQDGWFLLKCIQGWNVPSAISLTSFAIGYSTQTLIILTFSLKWTGRVVLAGWRATGMT